ncbi:MAG: hypothetical protein QE271_04930 [Bacteriovoracaceae bacterium]|nr:hypothetical protein [Bacteriovoracaceae bacterium]
MDVRTDEIAKDYTGALAVTVPLFPFAQVKDPDEINQRKFKKLTFLTGFNMNKIKLIIIFFLSSNLVFIFPTLAFDYKFAPETILMITHYYGYAQAEQQQRVKDLIHETLLNDGKVIINYDQDILIDNDFRSETQKKYTNFFDSKKLIFINSKVGEFINDTFPSLGTGLPIKELQEYFQLSKNSYVYVIGNYFGACHKTSLLQTLDLMYRTGLKIDAPIINIDLNLVTGRKNLSAHALIYDDRHGLLAGNLSRPFDIIVVKTNKKKKVTRAITQVTEEVDYNLNFSF